MPADDFAGTLGKSFREGEDTRSQLGVGDTIVWFENHPEEIECDVVNIVCKKCFPGFILGSNLLGSYHNLTTTSKINAGSFYGGCYASGSLLSLATGSTSGSWLSPEIKYNPSEDKDINGSVTDTGNTWRYITSNSLNGSVTLKFLHSVNDNIIGSITPTGSDNLQNLPFLTIGSDIKVLVVLGSATSNYTAPIVYFKPAVLGNKCPAINHLAESRIYQEFTESFIDSGSIDTGSTTGSIFYQEGLAGSLDTTFYTGSNDFGGTAYINTSGSKLQMASNNPSGRIYNVYRDFGDIYPYENIHKINILGSEVKFGSDIVKYYAKTSSMSNYQEFTLGSLNDMTSIGSNLKIRIQMIGNGANRTYLSRLIVQVYRDSGYCTLYPAGANIIQSNNLNTEFELSNFDKIYLDANGSNIANNVDFYVSSANQDNFFKVSRDNEIELSDIGSRIKWKAVYTKTTGSAIITTVNLIYKSEDY